MEIWLDTIDINLIQKAAESNIITGVTTNPSILSQSLHSPEVTLKQLLSIQPGYVAVQVIANDLEGMLRQARNLSRLSDRIIVKIPVTQEGFRAMSILHGENIRTMATAIFTPEQILLSAISKATYAAPYLGRIDESIGNGLDIINTMQTIINTQQFPLKLIAAAIRTTEQVAQSAKIGVGAITLPKDVYMALLSTHKLTEESLDKFSIDWASNPAIMQTCLF